MVGRVFPPDGPRTSGREGDPAEARVWRALSDQLPDGWCAWHSLKIRTVHRQFGEGDFVIADPQRGLLVMEVKGGRVSQSGGRFFYEGGRPMEPLQQAHGFANKLRKELQRVWPRRDEVPFGVCCCFPETAAENLPTNSDLRDLVLTELDLADLPAALARAMDATITRGNAPRDAGWIDALTELWGEDWVPRVGLLGRAKLRKQRTKELTEQQLAALRGLEANPRVIVSGGAGTGKSTVALRLAEDHAWAGQHVLYLCFTLPLSRRADRDLALARDSSPGRVRAVTVHALAQEIARAAKLPVDPNPQDPTGWEALLGAVADLPPGHPAFAPHRAERIVLDEGQSLSTTDWRIVDHLVTDDSALWIFRDRAQAFWEDRRVPERYERAAVRYELQHQLRMPDSVADLARACAEGHVPDLASLGGDRAEHDDGALRVVPRTGRPLPDTLGQELTRLLELGFAPHQLAVITLRGQHSSALFGRERIGGHRVVPADDPRADTHVVLDTFLRMQGLDRPVVLICERPPSLQGGRAAARLHMALTRASVGAVLLLDD